MPTEKVRVTLALAEDWWEHLILEHGEYAKLVKSDEVREWIEIGFALYGNGARVGNERLMGVLRTIAALEPEGLQKAALAIRKITAQPPQRKIGSVNNG